jgi:SAM-dependent methyltransferase
MTQAIENATAYNEALYEEFWARMPFMPPDGLPWWPMFKQLGEQAPVRLELGPGVFPRLPVAGTHVCDLSKVALDVLAKHGAVTHHGLVQDHKFPDGMFDLVGLFEVLEHVPDDEGLLRELARITKPGGRLTLTVPMQMKYFCSYDTYMGHVRRYDAAELRSKIERAGYVLEKFEVHKQSNTEPAASFFVFVMKHFPRFTAWALRYIFIPQLRRMRLDWYDASEWDARAPSAMDMGVVFRRVG